MNESPSDSEHAAAFIERCTQAVAQQVSGGATWKIVLPAPSDAVEREALRLFLAEFEAAVGLPPAQGSA